MRTIYELHELSVSISFIVRRTDEKVLTFASSLRK